MKMGSKIKITPTIELAQANEIRALANREIRSFAGMTRVLLMEALAARKAARKEEREYINSGEAAVIAANVPLAERADGERDRIDREAAYSAFWI